MILTSSVESSDRPSSNYHLGHSIKKRDPPGRKRQCRSRPRFLTQTLASHRRHSPG
jgi:hypothetical protein